MKFATLFLFILLDYSANDMIGVEDNSYREIVTFLGPLGGPKGALRGSPKKKKVLERGVQKNRDHLISLNILVSKYQKKIRFPRNFSESKIFLKSTTFFTFHGDLIADLIKSNFPLSLDFFIPKCHNKSRWQLLLEINHNSGPLRDSKGGPRGPRQKKKGS